MRALFGLRAVVVLVLAITPAVGCGGPQAYRLTVDSKVAPFKPTDPDDLVVDGGDDDDDEDEDEKSGGKGEAGEE